MENVDLNRPLRYRYSYVDDKYAVEVARFNKPTDYEFAVVFRGNGHADNEVTKKHFIIYPNQAELPIENVPEKRPWTELTQVPLNAWFRRKGDSTEVYKISTLKVFSGLFYLTNTFGGKGVEEYTVNGMFDYLEYTLDNPFGKDAKWCFCGTE